jgi:hypothetical protein
MSRHTVLALLFFLITPCLYAADRTGPPTKDSKEFGQTMVAEFTIDSATMEKFQKHIPDKPEKGELAIVAAISGASVDWYGDPPDFSAPQNPYHIVVTISGEARIDGDATSMWTAGWRDEEGKTISKPMAGLSKSDMKAGQSFVLTVASPPTSFQPNAIFSPSVSFLRSGNMTLRSVNVQIWSGIADPSALETFSGMRWLLLGLVMFGVWWLFKRM